MTNSAVHNQRAAVERAFVAFRYALGSRRAQLLKGLCQPCPGACRLADALGHNERMHRAGALAEGLKPIVKALDKMRVNCH